MYCVAFGLLLYALRFISGEIDEFFIHSPNQVM